MIESTKPIVMTVSNFFEALYSPNLANDLRGTIILAVKIGNGFRHSYFDCIPEACIEAKRLSKAGKDVYFAPALFENTDKKSNTGNRTSNKAAGAYSLWLDIDVGEIKAREEKGYETQYEAMKKLMDFCNTLGVKRPQLVVSSGFGIHVYWLFDEFIEKERWLSCARKLKALTNAHGFLADPSRTADIASVLRPIGTRNYKASENSQPVKKLYPQNGSPKSMSLSSFEDTINTAYENIAKKKIKSTSGTVSSSDIAEPCGKLLTSKSPIEPELFQSALNVIPVDLERDKWRNVIWSGMASGLPDAVDRLREWSQRSDQWTTKYRGKTGEECFTQFVADFDPTKGMGFGTFIHIAMEYGFKLSVSSHEAIEGENIASGLGVLPSSPKTLQEFNSRFFVAMIGGGCFIFDEEAENITGSAMSENAFKLRFKNIYAGEKPLAIKWLNWPGRRSYDAVDFDPRGNYSPNVYNIFRGLAVTPNEGCCDLIIQHIHDVLCGGNGKLFTYVIKWMALAVQRPWIKPQVALVMRSREGAGKSIIVAIFLKIFGQHGFTTASKDAVAGRFNAHLRDKIMVVLEEAFFAGDHAAIAAAKVLITNDDMSYEAKGKDPVSGRNYAHVICLSNHDWAVPAGEDSRRWCVLDVSDARVGDHAYFDDLAHEISNGGVEAFLHYLMGIGINRYNPRKVPQTEALTDQRRETMLNSKPVDAWFYGVLAAGEFPRSSTSVPWDTEVDSDFIQDSYQQFTARIPRAPHWAQAIKRIKELMPQGSMNKRRLRDGVNRRNVYSLPDIDDARECFRNATGVDPVPE